MLTPLFLTISAKSQNNWMKFRLVFKFLRISMIFRGRRDTATITSCIHLIDLASANHHFYPLTFDYATFS